MLYVFSYLHFKLAKKTINDTWTTSFMLRSYIDRLKEALRKFMEIKLPHSLCLQSWSKHRAKKTSIFSSNKYILSSSEAISCKILQKPQSLKNVLHFMHLYEHSNSSGCYITSSHCNIRFTSCLQYILHLRLFVGALLFHFFFIRCEHSFLIHIRFLLTCVTLHTINQRLRITIRNERAGARASDDFLMYTRT